MRADQHKEKSSKKSTLTFLLILIIVFIIGFIGFQTLNNGNPFKSVAKTEETTEETEKVVGKMKDKELQKLSEAMDSLAPLYKNVDLVEFKPDLTLKEVEEAKKKVDALNDESKVKKELVDRIKEAQKFVKTKESK